MDMFKVEGRIYNTEGTLTNDYEVAYFGSADNAEVRYKEMDNRHYENEDGTQGGKVFKMSLYVQSYKKIEDVTAFFAQFK